MMKTGFFLSEAETAHLTTCLGARRRRVASGEAIFHEGDRAKHFGIVLSGAVNVVRYSADGHKKLLAHLGAGEAFGTSFVFAGAPRYFASIEADGPTEALLINGAKMLHPCDKSCAVHLSLLARLLETIARRNSLLARKIDCLTQRTTAEKLMAYLRMRAELSGSSRFEIPFTREQLADYLNVDRSALSTEIGKLVKSGRIKTTRKHFELRP